MTKNTKHAAVALLACGATALGQGTIEWASPVDGLYSEPANWMPAVVPGAIDTAVLGGVGAYFVAVDAWPTIFGLAISNPDAVLGIDDGRIVTLGDSAAGGFTGPGAILINTQGGFATTRLQLRGSAMVGGPVLLNTPGGQMPGLRSQITALGPAPAVVTGDGSVTGRGRIAGGFVNNGVIGVDEPDHWLQVSRADIDQRGGGLIRLGRAGVIELLDSTVRGGTWLGEGEATLSGARSMIVDPHLEGAITIAGNAQLTLAGTVAGPGVLRLAPGDGSSIAEAIGATGATIEVPIHLEANTPAEFSTALLSSDFVETATIGPNGSVSGSGSVEGRWRNNGIIEVEGPDGMLHLRGPIDQSPSGVVRSPAGGMIRVSNYPITGGRWISSESGPPGRLSSSGGGIGNGWFEHEWLVEGMILYGTSEGPGLLTVTESALADRDATIDLATELAGGDLVFHVSRTASIGPSGVVRGRGRLRDGFTNDGLIHARAPDDELTFSSGDPVDNASGRVLADPGGTIIVNQGQIIGGLVESTGGVVRLIFGGGLTDARMLAGTGGQAASLESTGFGPGIPTNTIEGGRLEGHWVLAQGGLLGLAGHVRSAGDPGLEGWLLVEDLGTGGPGTTTVQIAADATIDAPIWLGSSPTTGGSRARLERGVDDRATIGALGTIAGSGAIRGSYTVEGTLSPAGPGPTGDEPLAGGVLRLDPGQVELTASAVVAMDIGGREPERFDRLLGGGDASLTLAGTLAVRFVDGFEPAADDRFEIARTLPTTGRFSAYDIDPVPGPAAGAGPAHLVHRGAGMTLVICAADRDGDGELTVFDFLGFQNQFASGDPRADLDGDGALTIFDFLAFQNAFDAGC